LISESIEKNRSVWLHVLKILDVATCRLSSIDCNDLQLVRVFDTVLEEYGNVISRALKVPSLTTNDCMRFAYTAMHGVGYKPFTVLFEKFGFSSPVPVTEQVDINPEFPTVPFPNPEENGALKLAISSAELAGCHMVLANDPDADRFTCVEKQKDGTWYQFSGDEIGLLFCDWQLIQFAKQKDDGKTGLVVSSVVSSRMASELCRVRAAAAEAGNLQIVFADCLTGFKWIANESIRRRSSGEVVHLLGYEEAIGYQLTSIVPDKDGISAACVWAQMACYWRSSFGGKTLKERFDEIQSKEIGFFVNSNGYYIIDDPGVTKSLFAEFRNSDAVKNMSLGGLPIKSIRDVTNGTDTALAPGEVSHLPKTPDAEMITITFKNSAVVTIRASGTEPKVKYYSELSSKDSKENAKRELRNVVDVIKREFYKPHIFPMKEQPVM